MKPIDEANKSPQKRGHGSLSHQTSDVKQSRIKSQSQLVATQMSTAPSFQPMIDSEPTMSQPKPALLDWALEEIKNLIKYKSKFAKVSA